MLIEKIVLEGPYEMAVTQAIVEHTAHGRILITQGFGGMDSLEGGCVRWKHGLTVRLLPHDTFDTLDAPYNEWASVKEAALSGYDADRPVLPMEAGEIQRIAEAAGL